MLKSKFSSSYTYDDKNPLSKYKAEINKKITSVYTKRNKLLRELKETNDTLIKLTSQLDLADEYDRYNLTYMI
tara:strand:- start:432 stop:650 length:219 start_codon:yes stop_codon:yes gene_type:complete